MMNFFRSLCLAAVLLTAAFASDPGDSGGAYRRGDGAHDTAYSGHGSSYGSSGGSAGGYDKSKAGGYHPGGGYHRGSRGGYGGYGGYHPIMQRLIGDEPLNELDKLYQRMSSVLDQLKSYEEQVDALSADLSIQVKKLKALEDLKAVELQETDMRQDAAIAKLQGHLTELMTDAVSLVVHVNSLEMKNWDNTENEETADKLWAEQQAINNKQTGQITMIYTAVKEFKEKLLQVKNNQFELFRDTVERDTTTLTSIKTKETRRMCESGQVTLTSIDTRAEYQYQSWFDNNPQVILGLCGFNFNLDTRDDVDETLGGFGGYGGQGGHGGYGGYGGYGGQGGYYRQPEAIGVRVNAYTTKTGLNLQAHDLSFGDTSAVSVDVCFQACTIGPGTGPVDH